MIYTAILFATIVRVIDGDTLVVNLPCDIDLICSNVPLRVMHIDTPEIRGKCHKEKQLAQQAKAITSSMFKEGSTIIIASAKRDKFYRILADVPALSKRLIDEGFARRYEGGVKSSWCN